MSKTARLGRLFAFGRHWGVVSKTPLDFTTAHYRANVNAAMELRVRSLRYPHNRMVNKLLFHNMWWRTNRESVDVCDSSAIRSPFTPKVNASTSYFQRNLIITFIFQILISELFKF